jgi:hypothetical protein
VLIHFASSKSRTAAGSEQRGRRREVRTKMVVCLSVRLICVLFILSLRKFINPHLIFSSASERITSFHPYCAYIPGGEQNFERVYRICLFGRTDYGHLVLLGMSAAVPVPSPCSLARLYWRAVMVVVLLSNVYIVGAEFSYIEITAPASIAGKYGCMPTLFGSTTPLSDHITGSLVVSDRGASGFTEKQGKEGCEASHVGVPVGSNSVLLVDRSTAYGCTTQKQAKVAVGLGASGILIAATMEKELPPTTGYTARSALSIPACAISKATAGLIRGVSVGSVSIDWAGYTGWSSSTEPVPPHAETPIEITSPWNLKWTYPAAMASFNPHSHPSTAGELVSPSFKSECTLFGRYTSSLSSCAGCFKLDTKFERAQDLAGKILLFTEYPICFSNYHQYSYLAQEVGAAGVIMMYPSGDNLPQSVGTFTVPYEITIPQFVVKRSHARYWEDVLTGTSKASGIQIHMVLPAIKNRWGPAYTPHEDDMQSLPDTALQFWGSTNTGERSSDSDCSLDDINGGQATYNPASKPEFSAPLVLASVDPSCEALGDQHGQGRDCTSCMQKLQSSTAILNAAELSGKVALLFGKDMYCAHEYIDITKAIQQVSAKAMILVNDKEHTFTLIAGRGVDPALRSSITIPTFNVGKGEGEKLSAKISSCAIVGKTFQATAPAIDSTGRAPPLIDHVRSQTYANLDGGHLGPTELTLKRPGVERTVEAGQAVFNPKTSDMMSKRMVIAMLEQYCSSETSCHLCHLLDSPFFPGQFFNDRIVVLKLSEAQCIRPIYNYVLAAQSRGAKGVLFVTKDNFTLTLGPAPSDEDQISIPSFTVSKVAYEEAGGDSMARYGTAVLPQIEKYEAPENIVRPKQPISVNNAATNQEIEQSSQTIDKESADGFAVTAGIWIPILCIVLLFMYCVGKRIKKIRKRNQLFAFGHMTHEIQTQTFQGEENAQFSTLFPTERPLNTKLGRERKIRDGAAGAGNPSSPRSKNVSIGREVSIELNSSKGLSGTNRPSASMLSYIEEGGGGRHQLSLQNGQNQRRENGNDNRAQTASSRRNSIGV